MKTKIDFVNKLLIKITNLKKKKLYNNNNKKKKIII